MCTIHKAIKIQNKISDDELQWIILTEEKLELLINSFIKNYFQKIDENLYLIGEFLEKNINLYAKYFENINFDPRQKFINVGSTLFKEYKFPPVVKEWFQKSGIDEQLKIILSVNTDKFKDDFFNIQKSALSVGGQSAFKSLELMIDFAVRDLNVEKYYEKYAIKLTDQLVSEIQSKIKYEILSGIKNAESIPDIRNRILSVYNKPITINVNSKLDASGKVLRSGYSYDMKASQWATTVARTEVMNAYSQGKLIGFRQMGVVDKVEFSTAPDERTCPVCQSLNGSVYNLEDADGIIPQHPNCRCMWIPILSENLEDETKSAYDNVSVLYLETMDFNNVSDNIDSIINDNIQDFNDLSSDVDEAIKDVNIKINEFIEKYKYSDNKFLKDFKGKIDKSTNESLTNQTSDGIKSMIKDFNINQYSENSKDFRYFVHKSLGSILFYSKINDNEEKFLINDELVDLNDKYYYNKLDNGIKLDHLVAIKLNSIWHQNLFTKLFNNKEITVFRSFDKEYLKELGYGDVKSGSELDILENGISVWTLYKGENKDDNNIIFSVKINKSDIISFFDDNEFKFILLNKNVRKVKAV